MRRQSQHEAAELRAELLQRLSERTHALPYHDAKIESEEIDTILGIETSRIEQEIIDHTHVALTASGQQAWIGLPVQSMLTPYSEFAQIVRELSPKPGSTWVDLGAAYGRLGAVLGVLAPETSFIGYELIERRADEANALFERLGLSRASVHAQDLSLADFSPAEADCYFIYDFGTREAVSKTLEDLKNHARRKPLTVVARGRGSRSWIERNHPWLASIVAPHHAGTYSIYRTV